MNTNTNLKVRTLLECIKTTQWHDQAKSEYNIGIYRRGIDTIHDKIFELTALASNELDSGRRDSDRLISLYKDMICRASEIVAELHSETEEVAGPEKQPQPEPPEVETMLNQIDGVSVEGEYKGFKFGEKVDAKNIYTDEVDRLTEELDDMTKEPTMSKNARRQQ